MKLHPAILELFITRALTHITEITFTKASDVILYAQRIMGSGVLIVPPPTSRIRHVGIAKWKN
jgi:hypothetical protein